MANKEIDDFLGDLPPGAGGPAAEEPTGEAEVEIPPVEETPEEKQEESPDESEKEDEVETPPVETQEKPPPIETPPTEPEGEEDKTTQLENQVKALMEQINLLSQGIQPKVEQPAAKPETPPVAEVTKSEAEKPKVFSLYDGLPGDTPEERFGNMITNPKVFEQTMAKMAKFIQDITYGNILRTLPVTVTQLVQSTTNATEMVNGFYKENSDLASVKPYVRKVLDGLAEQHPEWEISKLFEETAKTARQALGLKKPVGKPGSQTPVATTPPKKLPAFAKGQRANQSRGSSGGGSDLQKQVNELLNF